VANRFCVESRIGDSGIFVSILVVVQEASGFHAEPAPRGSASQIMCTNRPSGTTKKPGFNRKRR
jgi:hypothetical protein